MTAPRRVVVLHRNLAFGGAERVVVEQVRALAPLDCDVDVVTTREDDPADLADEVRAANPRVRRIGSANGTTRLLATLIARRYDLALTSIGRSAWKALARARRVPLRRRPAVIATVHSDGPEALEPLAPWAADEVDVVLLMYDFRARAAEALRVPASRLAVAVPIFPSVLLPTGPEVDEAARRLRASWGVPEGALVVGCLGRVAPEKGIHHVIPMVGRLVEQGRDLHFVVLGRRTREATPDGEAFTRVWDAAVAAAPALRGRLHLPGPTAATAAAYRAFDLTVLCSRHEGLGLVTLETLSVGTPLLVTTVGAVPTSFTDGVHAALVSRHPSDGSEPGPEMLAAFESRMASLLDDPALRRRLAAAGQERVRALVAANDFAGDFRQAVDLAMRVRDERG